jgi:hypothetical protein
MASVVSMYTKGLTTEELVTLNLNAALGQDAAYLQRIRPDIYAKVSGLFTENGGTRMHEATKDAIASLAFARIEAERKEGGP